MGQALSGRTRARKTVLGVMAALMALLLALPAQAAGFLDFSGGFAGATNLTLNGTAAIVGSALQLTDGGYGEDASAYSNAQVDITNFKTTFTFRLEGDADGITFTAQRVSPNIVGGGGGGLGSAGVTPSVTVKYDIWDNAGEGSNSTGLYTNGTAPTNGPTTRLLDGTAINFHTGHVFRSELSYSGTTLSETITDTETSGTFSTTYTVDIPATVGASTAFVGFTGATGGARAAQSVLTWTFGAQNLPPNCSTVAASPSLLWPPNHSLQPVSVAGATDPDGDTVSLTVTAVTQDEAVNGEGDGNVAPDAAGGSASDIILLRAERSALGDGRVYRVAVTAADGRGGTCSTTILVRVPHDERPDSVPVDSGLVVDSFTP